MKRALPALLALSLIALVTACSGGDGAATAASSAAPSGSPPASPSPVDLKIAGGAAAEKINLQSADLLPGFATSPDSEGEGGFVTEETTACIGIPLVEPVVSKSSADFTKGVNAQTVQYFSGVDFYAVEGQLAAKLSALQGPKADDCLAKELKKELIEGVGGELTLSRVVVTRFSPAAPGADGSFGMRFTITGKARGQSIPFTVDILGFNKGRTEVSLFVIAVGQNLPTAERDALFAKLVSRGVLNAL